MAISQVGAATTDSGEDVGTVTATKPTGVQSGDFLLAFVFYNDAGTNTIGGPSGWTEHDDTASGLLQSQVWYKVAGGSEPASYTWTETVDNIAAIFGVAVTAWRGVDTAASPIFTDSVESITTHAEPMNVVGLTTTVASRILYLREVRDDTVTPITFTASGVTELFDFGQASNTSAYSMALYDDGDQVSPGATGDLNVTASASETHNIGRCLALKIASALPLGKVLMVDQAAHVRAFRY